MKLVWSDAALQSIEDTADFTREHFGIRQVRLLREKIKAAQRKTLTFPESCPLEQSLLGLTTIYRYVTIFPKLELVYHKENEDTIMIDLLWNSRRNPSSLQAIVGNNEK